MDAARKARLADAREYAGIRQAHYAVSNGALIVVVDAVEQGLDPDGGRWYTICDDHGHAICHATLALAKSFAAAPEQWCESCMDEKET